MGLGIQAIQIQMLSHYSVGKQLLYAPEHIFCSRTITGRTGPLEACACALNVPFFSRIMMVNSLAGMMMMIAADPSLPLPPPHHPIMKVPSCLPPLCLSLRKF